MPTASLLKTSAAALAASFLLLSVAVAEPLTVAPRVKAGDSFTLFIKKSKERRTGNNPAQRTSAETSVAVTILESSENRVVLAWTFGETRLVDTKAESDARSKALMDLGRGIRLDLELEGPGWAPRVRNYDEVKARFDRVQEEVLKLFRDDRERDRVRQALTRMFASREAMEASVLREAIVYLFPLGKTVETGKPFTYETQIGTPLSDKPIPARGTVALASWDQIAGQARIEWTQTLDRAVAGAVVKEWFERMAKQAGKPMPTDAKLPELEISDKAEYTILTKSGMSQSARHTRRVTAPGASETQTMEFLRK